MEPDRYVRKPFWIDAKRVTEDNMTDIATWCGGEIQIITGATHILVPVHNPQDERQRQAYVGDWVLKSGRGFKVYTDKAFNNSFELPGVPKAGNVFTSGIGGNGEGINSAAGMSHIFGGGGAAGNPGGTAHGGSGEGGAYDSGFPHVQ